MGIAWPGEAGRNGWETRRDARKGGRMGVRSVFGGLREAAVADAAAAAGLGASGGTQPGCALAAADRAGRVMGWRQRQSRGVLQFRRLGAGLERLRTEHASVTAGRALPQ